MYILENKSILAVVDIEQSSNGLAIINPIISTRKQKQRRAMSSFKLWD